MARTTSIREEHTQFDLLIPDDIPEIYCDGLSEAMMGYPLCKLTLHTVIAPALDSKSIEQRQAKARLVIPTHALLEMCTNLLRNTVEQKSAVDAVTEEAVNKFKDLLNSLQNANLKS